MRLLPGNSTPLERLAAEALAQIERVPVPIRDLVNPERCPVALLPFLAWAFSVDRWDSTWSEPVKRRAIRSSYFVHSRKGTIGALRRVVEPLGYLIEITEWWQTDPAGVPGTFAVQVGVLDTGITEEMYRELTLLIDDAKPLTRHITALAISMASSGHMRLAAALTEGEEIDVYPPMAHDIEVAGRFGVVGREHQIEYLEIYP